MNVKALFVLLLFANLLGAHQSSPTATTLAMKGPYQKYDDNGNINPSSGGGNGAALAQCLATAQANYTVCMANAPNFIPYIQAYNIGKCEATLAKDRIDCINQYGG